MFLLSKVETQFFFSNYILGCFLVSKRLLWGQGVSKAVFPYHLFSCKAPVFGGRKVPLNTIRTTLDFLPENDVDLRRMGTRFIIIKIQIEDDIARGHSLIFIIFLEQQASIIEKDRSTGWSVGPSDGKDLVDGMGATFRGV